MCNTGNGNGGGEEWDPCSKKQKNQHNKPRQRGLGVAKLERILREQKDKEENKLAVAEFSSRLLSALPRQYQPPSSSFLCPMAAAAQPPMPVMSLPPSSTNSAKHVTLSPASFPVLHGNAGMNSTNGVGGGGGGNGGFAEPAATGCCCFAKICEASLHGEGPQKDSRIEPNRINAAPLVLQREQHTYQTPSMNPSPLLSAAWSTSFSAGRNHHIEHPSNQRPYADYTFVRPEEQKMGGTKRPWPFSNDQPSVLCYSSPFPADKQKAYDSAIMVEPSKTVSREANRSSHFGLNSTRSFKHSSSDGNFLTLGLPGSLSPARQTTKLDFSEVNLLPLEGRMGGHHQRPPDPKPSGSIRQKPSIEAHMGWIGTSLSLNYLIDEAEEDSIDLDLKL